MGSNTPQPQHPYVAPQPTAEQRAQSKRTLWIILGSIGGVLIVCCAFASIAAAVGGHNSASATVTTGNHQVAQNAPTVTVMQKSPPKSTATLVPKPTATPVPKPTATSVPKPSATPVPQTQPTATPCPGVNCNPWGYNFTSGNDIYSPPSSFCNYFNCILSFWSSTNGYVVECQDATYSHSGGRSGACSDHGGEWRALLS
jgi:hypothetical protein